MSAKMNYNKAKMQHRAKREAAAYVIGQNVDNVVQSKNKSTEFKGMVYHKRGYNEVDTPNAAHRGHLMNVREEEKVVDCKYGVCTAVFRCKDECRIHAKFGRVANTIDEDPRTK